MAHLLSTGELIELARAAGVRVSIERPERSGPETPQLYIWEDSASDALYIGKAESAARLSNERKWRSMARFLDLTESQAPDDGIEVSVVSGFISLLRQNPDARAVEVWFEGVGEPEEPGSWWRHLEDLAHRVAGDALSGGRELSGSFRNSVTGRYWVDDVPTSARAVDVASTVYAMSEHPARRPADAEVLANWLLYDLRRWKARDPEVTIPEVENLLIRVAVRSGALIANSHFAGQWESSAFHRCDTLALMVLADADRAGRTRTPRSV